MLRCCKYKGNESDATAGVLEALAASWACASLDLAERAGGMQPRGILVVPRLYRGKNFCLRLINL